MNKSEGKVIRITEKNFGFIRINKSDYFFHKDHYLDNWNDLTSAMHNNEEINVSCEIVESAKGLRVENVRRL